MNGYERSRQLGHAKELLQALIIASERSEDVREQCMLRIAQQAADALKGRLAA